jgi:hypothetical protein
MLKMRRFLCRIEHSATLFRKIWPPPSKKVKKKPNPYAPWIRTFHYSSVDADLALHLYCGVRDECLITATYLQTRALGKKMRIDKIDSLSKLPSRPPWPVSACAVSFAAQSKTLDGILVFPQFEIRR